MFWGDETLIMSVFRSSRQLSNVCSSGGCSSRSTQRHLVPTYGTESQTTIKWAHIIWLHSF